MNNGKRNCGSSGAQFVDSEKSVELLNCQGENGIIDIKIDKVTPCLEEVKTGKIVDTQYNKISINKAFARQLNTEKWKFDWDDTTGEIYQLTLDHNRLIQGLISLKDRGSYVYVELVESAPQNVGKDKVYAGVGGHLFAIAAEKSFAAGYEGYVVLTPKTALVEHYKSKLGAMMMPSGKMYLDDLASIKLVKKYIKRSGLYGR